MTTNFWQNYQFGIDPWGGEYEIPVQIGEEVEESVESIRCDVENVPWAACRPIAEPTLPERIIFIDGRRRVDLRVVGSTEGQIAYGAFATIAVGAVLVDLISKQSSFLEPVIRRALAFTTPDAPPSVHIIGPQSQPGDLHYNLHLNPKIPKHEFQIPVSLIQIQMLAEEARLANRLAHDGEELIIRDGPLLFGTPGFILGYVKTMGKSYLDQEHSALLWKLQPGERTPIIQVQKKSGLGRWIWYLRSGSTALTSPKLGYHGLHGIIRLELEDHIKLAQAQHIANQTTRLIPRFASQPHKDPRAPQNLIPVGALEKELGRRMGDATLVNRRIQRHLSGVLS